MYRPLAPKGSRQYSQADLALESPRKKEAWPSLANLAAYSDSRSGGHQNELERGEAGRPIEMEDFRGRPLPRLGDISHLTENELYINIFHEFKFIRKIKTVKPVVKSTNDTAHARLHRYLAGKLYSTGIAVVD
uniref:SFRICE_025811 n=1 Tax=Spodoptera frugiperda TaxID=7108 RepID=A0A2H1WMG0_SPOFR